jgi:spore germination protein GerM
MNRLKSFVLIMVSFGLWFVRNGCDQELHLIEHQAYFLDDQTSSLVPERRQYGMKAKQERSEWVLNQLIKGPKRRELQRTIPKGTKLLSISVEAGVAYVNFPEEFKSKQLGGLIREAQTIDSVFLTLTQPMLDHIKKVQFLVEGEKLHSLAGYANFDEPISQPTLPR